MKILSGLVRKEGRKPCGGTPMTVSEDMDLIAEVDRTLCSFREAPPAKMIDLSAAKDSMSTISGIFVRILL